MGGVIDNNNNNVGSGGTGGSGKSKSSQDGRHTQGREFRRPSTIMLREKACNQPGGGRVYPFGRVEPP